MNYMEDIKPIKSFQFHYEIDADPVPKGRPRFTSRGHAFTPKRTRVYQEDMKATLAMQAPHEPIKGPLAVRIIFFIERPKSVKKEKRPYPCVKPDVDNFVKAILDCSNKIIWEDDGQIVDLFCHKRYADECTPRVILSVEKVGG